MNIENYISAIVNSKNGTRRHYNFFSIYSKIYTLDLTSSYIFYILSFIGQSVHKWTRRSSFFQKLAPSTRLSLFDIRLRDNYNWTNPVTVVIVAVGDAAAAAHIPNAVGTDRIARAKPESASLSWVSHGRCYSFCI